MAESELTTIARPYARALFAHVLGSGANLDDWSATLALLSAITNDREVQRILDDPSMTRRARVDLMLGLAGDQLSEPARNFVTIVAEQNRIEALPDIASLFELMKRNHLKRVEVQLTSAYEVADADAEKIRAALAASLKREISVETRVDPTLLGGAIVRTGDTVLDYSVRGKLNKLGQELNS